METLAYEDFSLGLHQKLIDQRVPVHGAIEVTHRCPLNCVHCYNNLPLKDQEARRRELSLDQHCRILDEITEAGCFWLLLTGGEIFARQDFLETYTYAIQKGLVVTLFTNGVLINEQIADQLTEWRPFAIEISLYGRTPQTYESVTRVPNSYDRCMQAIHLCLERDLPLKLKSMALSVNKHEIRDMKRFVEEDLGLEFKVDGMINPRVDCSKAPLEVRLSPEEILELDLADPERVKEWRRFVSQYISPSSCQERQGSLYQCGAGRTSFAVDPYGLLRACVLSNDETYDLRRGNFEEGWQKDLFRLREAKAAKPNKCVSCTIKTMCGMCPANGELENGDPETPVDFLCQVAHLRAEALGIEVPYHGECEYCETKGALRLRSTSFEERPKGLEEHFV